MKILISGLILFLGGTWFYQQQPVGKNDIYVNRLVYFKGDSSLFTGTLKVADRSSYSYTVFCKGVPCGESSEHQIGGNYIWKGQYLNINETLSKTTLKMLQNDTSILVQWQEGGDFPTDPYRLTIIILKNDDFFESDKIQYQSYFEQLANAVMNDTRNIKYEYLKINFVNAVLDWNKDFYKQYKFVNGKLQEEPQE